VTLRRRAGRHLNATSARQQEIACYVPQGRASGEPGQLNDLTVTPHGTIYVTDRAGSGLYILQPELDLGQDRA
jgi:sugar lactone lactonase YvrE